MNINEHLKPLFFSPTEDITIPALNYSNIALVLKPDDKAYIDTYNNFYATMKNFLLKLPSSTAKSSVQELLDRKLIVLSRLASSNVKTGVTGSFSATSSGKLGGVALDIVNFDIDMKSGETQHIDDCFYAAYLQFIRAAIILNANTVKKDEDLHELTTKYYYYLMLRLLGKNVVLNDKQKLFLLLITKYFYYRFFIGQFHDLALENTLSGQPKEVIAETKDTFARCKKYVTIKDIFKAFIDFHISIDPPQILIVNTISKFKPTTFQAFMSSLDYLIGMSIVGKYPNNLFQGAIIDSALQNKIEKLVTGYLHKVAFDPLY